jgi:hypothetical protein
VGTTSGTGGTGDGGVVVGAGGADPCNQSAQIATQTIYVLIDQDGDLHFELSVTRQIPIDMTPPPAPASVSTAPGNQALVVKWDAVDPAADASGILGYQVLCARADQYAVFQPGAFKPSFDTTATNCPDKALPSGNGIDHLDANYVCSDLLSPAATSARIKILENNIAYSVRVLAIDKHRNASPSAKLFGIPEPSVDFYNVYRNDNPSTPGQPTEPGQDSGGYCAVLPGSATERGLAWSALGGAAVAAAMLAARRRRKRR